MTPFLQGLQQRYSHWPRACINALIGPESMCHPESMITSLRVNRTARLTPLDLPVLNLLIRSRPLLCVFIRFFQALSRHSISRKSIGTNNTVFLSKPPYLDPAIHERSSSNMAIYSAVPPPPELAAPTTSGHQHSLSNASTATVDVEAWTVSALQSLSINPLAVGTGNPLTIPLDEHRAEAAKAAQLKLRNVRIAIDPVGASITPPRRPPSRRDSMRRREALLKGNEGSRQRRRWENGK